MAKTAAERAKAYRDAKRDAVTVENVTNQSVTVGRDDFALTQDGLDDMGEPETDTRPELFAARTNPELLNFGPWLNADQLKVEGLKANRVPIPGDYDYKGVAAY